ncbi:MAG: segregation and condensation protein A [Thermacetogeniaceae bacterium]
MKNEEIPVSSVSVCEVIDQFFHDNLKSDVADLEEGSRLVVAMATLLSVKAQLLLPKKNEHEGDENDESNEGSVFSEEGTVTEELEPGSEYLFIKEAVAFLEKKAKEWSLFCKRPPSLLQEKTIPDEKRLDVSLLVSAFREVLKRSAPLKPYCIQSPPIDICEKIEAVMSLLAEKPEGILFQEMFSPSSSREELIITFVAILELVYQGKIRVRQENPSGDIYIFCPK